MTSRPALALLLPAVLACFAPAARADRVGTPNAIELPPYASPCDDRGGSGHCIQKVIQPGDIVRTYLQRGRNAEGGQRLSRTDPLKIQRQGQVPGMGRDAGNQQRHENTETTRGTQAESHTDT